MIRLYTHKATGQVYRITERGHAMYVAQLGKKLTKVYTIVEYSDPVEAERVYAESFKKPATV